MIFTVNGELYSSKNSRQIFFNPKTGRRFVAKSDVAKQDERELYNKPLNIKSSFLTVSKGKLRPLRVRFKIYRKTRRIFDYVNIIQNLLDSMVKVGLLPDDNANEIIPVFDPYELDPIKPRVEMEIL